MTTRIDEGISSLFDDNIQGDDKEHMLNQLCQDQELKERWSRYQIVHDSLQRKLSTAVDPHFSTRIMAALESEPTVLAPKNTISSFSGSVRSALNKNMGKRVAGLAIAASVTAVSVLSFQYNYQQQTKGQFDVATTDSAKMLSSKNVVSLDGRIRSGQSPALLSSAAGSANNVSSAAQNASTRLSTSEIASPSVAHSFNRIRNPIQINSSQVNMADPAISAQLHKYLINHSQHVSGTRLQGVMPFARIVTGSSMSTLPIKKQQ